MNNIRFFTTLSIGTLILSIVGFYNGYPLVYSDTGTYIYSGFDGFIPNDRPIVYGLFLKLISLKYSTWFVVIIQNFATALILHQTIKLFRFNKGIFHAIYFTTLLFLALFTGIGWYSNQLMPDFLAPLTVLSIFILLAKNKILSSSTIPIVLILTLGLITHFSHLLIGSTLIFILLTIKLISSSKIPEISLSRMLIVATIILSGWIMLPTINFIFEKKFILSKGSHVFLLAHLNDTGILKEFLDENCTNPEFKDYKLCEFKDSLPPDLASFIWDGSILKDTGGWIESKDEYSSIIRGTIKQPKYLLLNVYRSVTNGLIQLTMNDIGQGLSPYNEGSAPFGQIQWRFNSELNNYKNSRQNKWERENLNLKNLNSIHFAILIISLFIISILFSNSKLRSLMDRRTMFFLTFLLLSIIANSFITAGLNAPCERFQARIVWLLPFALIILFAKNFKPLFKISYKQFKEWSHFT